MRLQARQPPAITPSFLSNFTFISTSALISVFMLRPPHLFRSDGIQIIIDGYQMNT